MSKLRHWVFWPPFLLLLGSTIYSGINVESYLEIVTALNDWILENFGWLFSFSTFGFLLICIWVYFSKIGKLKIGGADAQPILSKWRWFAITLTTTVAIGILFWSSAEPLYHLHQPPKDLGFDADSPESARFALSTMYMHWTFTPYGIYTLAGLMFALVYYNLRQPFSIGSMLYPLIGNRATGSLGKFIDAICLFSLVAGMAASLGSGILTIAGGLETMLNISRGPLLLAGITAVIVVSFIISAASGLLKGIRILSNINIQVFIMICIFILIAGPTLFIFQFGVESLGDYFYNFFQRSLYTGAITDSDWVNSWTIFYWANWLAWTPVTALFLGRLSVGYTVRDYIHFNLLLPSIFGCVWMMVFSGTSIHMDFYAENDPLYEVLNEQGHENVMYAIFERLPFAQITSFIFLLVSFLSYVTAADSNTSAMSGLSSTGISPTSPEPSFFIKLLWGSLVGIVAWVMVAVADVEGIKMASNLGGFPALFLIIGVAVGMVLMVQRGDLLK